MAGTARAARRYFLLSPASTAGQRAKMLFRAEAEFALARQVRHPEGAPIGEVFSFLSGLYFRGKLTYARHFATPRSAIRVITSDRGLVPPGRLVTLDDLLAMSRSDIDLSHAPYRTALEQSTRRMARSLEAHDEVVLLGSIATPKYADILYAAFGARLRFPFEFIGRGDMSRGGMLLRAVREEKELEYRPLVGAVAPGKRPARLGSR